MNWNVLQKNIEVFKENQHLKAVNELKKKEEVFWGVESYKKFYLKFFLCMYFFLANS